MDLGKRRNAVTVVGETGSGKTTLVMDIIDSYLPERGMVTILDTQGEKMLKKYPEIPMEKIILQKSGTYRVTSGDWQEFITQCAINYAPKTTKKGMLYIDDADKISQTEYKPITDLMGGVRHKELDFMSSFHLLWRVPSYIMDNSQILILFKTGESIDKGDLNRFKHGQRIAEAFEEVEANIDRHFYKVIPLYGF